MTTPAKTAVVGRYVVDKPASLPDWQVVGLSRRVGESNERVDSWAKEKGDQSRAN